MRPCQDVCTSVSAIDICRRCSSSSQSPTVEPDSIVPEPVHLAGLIEERLDERGLAGATVTDDSDVANLSGLGCSHARPFLLEMSLSAPILEPRDPHDRVELLRAGGATGSGVSRPIPSSCASARSVPSLAATAHARASRAWSSVLPCSPASRSWSSSCWWSGSCASPRPSTPRRPPASTRRSSPRRSCGTR